MSKNNDNKSTIKLLRSQMRALRKAGETELADQLASRIEALAAQPPDIMMYFERGRVHFKTPYPGRARVYAFSMKLKEAGRGTHKYDPQTQEWSFQATPGIVEDVRQAIGDFFSEAPLVNREGRRIGVLPATTYKG